MERMDMHSRNEYLKVLKEGCFKAGSKKEKSQILDEYCRNTGQSRKYVLTKTHKADPRPRQRKKTKEIRLYKNFFQPVMKLQIKERIGSRVKRRYEAAKTPYHRLIDSRQIPEQLKDELKAIYLSLNPAPLKRNIDAKLAELYQAYEEKRRTRHVGPLKKLVPHMVRSYMLWHGGYT